MSFRVVYHKLVVEKDIPKLGLPEKKRIKTAILDKLTEKPEIFGKPLRHSLRGYRKLRVGDYRVIFRIDGRTVKILYIMHRSVGYKSAREF